MWEYAATPKQPPVAVYKAPRSLRAVRPHPTGAPLLLTAEVMDPTPLGQLPTAATHAEHMSSGGPPAEGPPSRSRRPSAFAAAAGTSIRVAAAADHAARLPPPSALQDAMPRVPSTHGFALPGGDEGSPGASLARAVSSGSLLATLPEDSMPRVASRSLLSAGIGGITRENSVRGSAETGEGLLADASAGSAARALVHAASHSVEDDVFGALGDLATAAVAPCAQGDTSPQRSPAMDRTSVPSDSSETSPQQPPNHARADEMPGSLVRSAPLPIRSASALMSRWLAAGVYCCYGFAHHPTTMLWDDHHHYQHHHQQPWCILSCDNVQVVGMRVPDGLRRSPPPAPPPVTSKKPPHSGKPLRGHPYPPQRPPGGQPLAEHPPV